MQDPVLIVGASGTIGGAVARRLKAEKRAVVLHGGTDSDRLLSLGRDLNSPTVSGDLSDVETVAAIAAREDLGMDRLSGIVFAAARPFPHKLTLRTDWTVFQDQIDSQLKALHTISTGLIPAMKNRPGGARIVVLSTEYVLGMPPQKIAPYAAAKAALTAYAKVLAQEVLKHDIRVHILAPGMVPSALTADMPDEYLAQVADGMPEKRLTAAEDVADVCSFLLRPAGDTLYGTVVPVSRAPRRV
ncbi:SDR family oxidoreductase [Rhodospirillaceae bacterium KN72]|uniref:SDR family oxidoreductase n=1 Tax=Pacificispira spongiicola TaxID=2729598 RepID=A0A7Y0DWT2_9PROT|nr:SDR family oxidoreductase [Pacificispira spongiicola]NMM43047.1 SDR family oxidoreductase [Pacificispira spongiicola]